MCLFGFLFCKWILANCKQISISVFFRLWWVTFYWLQFFSFAKWSCWFYLWGLLALTHMLLCISEHGGETLCPRPSKLANLIHGNYSLTSKSCLPQFLCCSFWPMIFSVASFIHCIYQIEKKMITTSLPCVQVFCLIPSLGGGTFKKWQRL